VQDGVGIQIVKLNPICEKEPQRKGCRGKENPRRKKARKSTWNLAGSRGMISGLTIWTSTRLFFKTPILAAFC
jgi:hypothetical protein